MSLGHATYLKSKDGGENSMSRKGGRTPYRSGAGPSDLCPMAKARLPEPQSPSVQIATPGRMRLVTGSDRFCSGWCVAFAARSDRSAATSGVLKGMSGEPKGLSGQPSRTTGSPHGREPHGDRALIVVSGRESRLQGEGGQVSEGNRLTGVRDAQQPESRHPRGYWRAGCTETCPSGSGRGGRKRDFSTTTGCFLPRNCEGSSSPASRGHLGRPRTCPGGTSGQSMACNSRTSNVPPCF